MFLCGNTNIHDLYTNTNTSGIAGMHTLCMLYHWNELEIFKHVLINDATYIHNDASVIVYRERRI